MIDRLLKKRGERVLIPHEETVWSCHVLKHLVKTGKESGRAIQFEPVFEVVVPARSSTSAAFSSATSVKDYKRKTRFREIATLAKKLNCGKVMLSDSAEDSALQLVSGLSLGVAEDLKFAVQIHDVQFLRPLREISAKELAFYALFNDVILDVRVDEEPPARPSIQDATRDFVLGLQDRGFLGTVPTLWRAADKVGAREREDLNDTQLDELIFDFDFRSCELKASPSADSATDPSWTARPSRLSSSLLRHQRDKNPSKKITAVEVFFATPVDIWHVRIHLEGIYFETTTKL